MRWILHICMRWAREVEGSDLAKQRTGSRTARHNWYLSPTQKEQIWSKKYGKSVYNRCASLIYTIWLYNLTRSTEISKDLLIWYLTFDIWHLTFDIWHAMTFDIPWHSTTFDIDMAWDDIIYAMAFEIWHWYTMTFDMTEFMKALTAPALILMILAQSYNTFTDGLCGLSHLSLIVSQSQYGSKRCKRI